jgi:glutamine synthetase
MVPGFEAPVYIAWVRGNGSTVIRVPVDTKNNFKSKRIEFRAASLSKAFISSREVELSYFY